MAEIGEFKKGRDIWRVQYFAGEREIVRLKLLNELKREYKCECEIFAFSSDNKLTRHTKSVRLIPKSKLEAEIWIYGYDLYSAIKKSIEYQKGEVERLQEELNGLTKEISSLERYREWFPSIDAGIREDGITTSPIR